jgi:hypothetical protein
VVGEGGRRRRRGKGRWRGGFGREKMLRIGRAVRWVESSEVS